MPIKKEVPAKPTRKYLSANPQESPTIYSNACAVTVMGGDIRITFQEVLSATPTEIKTRELINVYMNAEVGRQLAGILHGSLERALKETAARLEKAAKESTP